MIYFTMAVYSVPISQHNLFKICVFSPFEQNAPPAITADGGTPTIA